MKEKVKTYALTLLLAAILMIYLLGILFCNIYAEPYSFETDMYTDMNYAVKAWTSKSVFPDGWTFGNQLYVVATPNLAALIYGFIKNPTLSMGIASCCMSVVVLFLFQWMLKPMMSKQMRLLAVVLLLSITLVVANPIYQFHGWQLFFTMCSYYACYLIAAFLAFGCYIRAEKGKMESLTIPLAISCFMAFSTGIQSLRQTAVMVCPIMALEGLSFCYRLIQKKSVFSPRLLVAGLITISNVLGVVFESAVEVQQVEIFGKIQIVPFKEILNQIEPGLSTVLSLFFGEASLPPFVIYSITIGTGLLLGYLMVQYFLRGEESRLILLALFVTSIVVVLILDVITTMHIRNLYYFMMYPLAALVAVFLYMDGKIILRSVFLILTMLVFGFNVTNRLTEIPRTYRNPEHYYYGDVIYCLNENDIHTIYTVWNFGEKIVLSSDWEFDAGFWYMPTDPFVPVEYLCDKEVYHKNPENCAYIFQSQEEAVAAERKTTEHSLDFELLYQNSASNIYIYISNTNLMEFFGENV